MINENTDWPNRHTAYLSKTGGGKSQALKNNPDIPKRGTRLLLWDTNNDHEANRFSDLKLYAKAVAAGIRSGRGFRLAYTGGGISGNLQADFESWCKIVLTALDGKHRTYVIIEEAAAISPSAYKATPNAAILMNQGRKYGAVVHLTSQKPEEVAKTYVDNCEILFIGKQKGHNIKKYSDKFGIPFDELKGLNSLPDDPKTGFPPIYFFRCDDAAASDYEKVHIKYKK